MVLADFHYGKSQCSDIKFKYSLEFVSFFLEENIFQ